MIYIPTKYKESRRTLLIRRPSIPPVNSRFALVVQMLSWTLEGEVGLGRERFAYRICTTTHSAWSPRRFKKAFSRPSESYPNSPTWHQILDKKRLAVAHVFKTPYLSMIFKKSCENCDFENQIPTPQLDIKFWNPEECGWQLFFRI